jgi:hypothetical protein
MTRRWKNDTDGASFKREGNKEKAFGEISADINRKGG